MRDFATVLRRFENAHDGRRWRDVASRTMDHTDACARCGAQMPIYVRHVRHLCLCCECTEREFRAIER